MDDKEKNEETKHRESDRPFRLHNIMQMSIPFS